MTEQISAIINELVNEGNEYTKTKFAVYRAINLFPDINRFDESFVIRHARLYISKNKLPTVQKNNELINSIKLNKERSIKRVLGGSVNFPLSFWDQENAIELATNDDFFTEAQPHGNYAKTKFFLRHEWSNVDIFSVADLQRELTKKHPTESVGELFSIQRWGDGIYDFNTKRLLVKPLWKKIDYKVFANIFYKEV